MSKATITIEDTATDQIDMKIEFGEEGINEESTAHFLATKAATYLLSLSESDGEAKVND